jgi:hypothetical protein
MFSLKVFQRFKYSGDHDDDDDDLEPEAGGGEVTKD